MKKSRIKYTRPRQWTIIAFRKNGDPCPLKWKAVTSLARCRKRLAEKGFLYFNAYGTGTENKQQAGEKGQRINCTL